MKKTDWGDSWDSGIPLFRNQNKKENVKEEERKKNLIEVEVSQDGRGDTDKIQEAIDLLGEEGGKIIVYTGIYEKDVLIDERKKITIEGAGGIITGKIKISKGNEIKLSKLTFDEGRIEITESKRCIIEYCTMLCRTNDESKIFIKIEGEGHIVMNNTIFSKTRKLTTTAIEMKNYNVDGDEVDDLFEESKIIHNELVNLDRAIVVTGEHMNISQNFLGSRLYPNGSYKGTSSIYLKAPYVRNTNFFLNMGINWIGNIGSPVERYNVNFIANQIVRYPKDSGIRVDVENIASTEWINYNFQKYGDDYFIDQGKGLLLGFDEGYATIKSSGHWIGDDLKAKTEIGHNWDEYSYGKKLFFETDFKYDPELYKLIADEVRFHSEADKNLFDGNIKANKYLSSDGSEGATGTFTSQDGKTITIKDGLITDIS